MVPPPPRPVSSPPQLELVLLPSPSCYLIAEEPERPLPGFGFCAGKIGVVPWPSSSAGGKSVGTAEELSTRGLGHSSLTSEDGEAASGAWLLKQFKVTGCFPRGLLPPVLVTGPELGLQRGKSQVVLSGSHFSGGKNRSDWWTEGASPSTVHGTPCSPLKKEGPHVASLPVLESETVGC